MPPCICHPVYPPTHPGYTDLQHGEPGHGTPQARCARLTALTLTLAERNIRDASLTVGVDHGGRGGSLCAESSLSSLGRATNAEAP